MHLHASACVRARARACVRACVHMQTPCAHLAGRHPPAPLSSRLAQRVPAATWASSVLATNSQFCMWSGLYGAPLVLSLCAQALPALSTMVRAWRASVGSAPRASARLDPDQLVQFGFMELLNEPRPEYRSDEFA